MTDREMDEFMAEFGPKRSKSDEKRRAVRRWIQSGLASGLIKRAPVETVASKDVPVKRAVRKAPAYDADARARRKRREAWLRDTKLFMWDWAGGGYNSCRAKDADEALQKAREMGERGEGQISLVPCNVRETTVRELRSHDECWD